MFEQKKEKKKSWWKFWQRVEDPIDKFVHVKGLQSLMDYNRWCTSSCPLTDKIQKLKTSSQDKPQSIKKHSKLKNKISKLFLN